MAVVLVVVVVGYALSSLLIILGIYAHMYSHPKEQVRSG